MYQISMNLILSLTGDRRNQRFGQDNGLVWIFHFHTQSGRYKPPKLSICELKFLLVPQEI